LKGHVEALIARIAGMGPAEMPNISITTRDVEQVRANPPLVASENPEGYTWVHPASYADLLDAQPETTSIHIFAPVRFEKPERTHFEYWARLNRSTPGGVYCNDGDINRFIQRILPDEIRSLFNAGDRRAINSEETYQAFARGTVPGRTEYWLRPGWQIAHPAFLPFPAFPEQKPLPTRTPEQIEAKADGDRRRAVIRQSKSQMASRGLVYNPSRGSWGKPE
jgi:hypothetical protein